MPVDYRHQNDAYADVMGYFAFKIIHQYTPLEYIYFWSNVLSHLHEDKKILNRVKRLQGQVNAVELSITHPDASCIDVLQQVAAIKGAVNGLMNELVEAHLRHHVLAQAEQVNEEELAEFLKLLKRYG